MKMERKAFDKMVREMRRTLPEYNNGRRVVILSEYTKKGLSVLGSASHYDGTYLNQVYNNCSDAKRAAYDDAYEMYCNDKNASGFGICSHNTFGFTVSWVSPGKVIFLTPVTEYIVICNE